MDLQYPIGRFESSGRATPEQRKGRIADIAAAPAKFRGAVADLSPEQLDTPYRPGGWTVRQVIHHLPDSHMNAFIRFKLALTEDRPTIKPYNEKLWADLADVRNTPIEVSLSLLESIHQRWVVLLRSLTAEEFARTFVHPEYQTEMALDDALAMYAWHGAHHTAHVTHLRERMGWKPAASRVESKSAARQTRPGGKGKKGAKKR